LAAGTDRMQQDLISWVNSSLIDFCS